jgi:hypothetical protein
MAKSTASVSGQKTSAALRQIAANLEKQREQHRETMVKGGADGEEAAIRARSITNDIANIGRLVKRFESGDYQ